MRRMLIATALLLFTACSGTTKPDGAAEHGAGLALHESADLAAHLVEIPGYTYVNPPSDEIDASLARLHAWEDANHEPDYFTAVSFHGVVADDRSENEAHTASGGWELGYLELVSFRYVVTVGLADDPKYFTWTYDGSTVPEQLSIAGTTVFKFVDPDHPYSKYMYMWIRHGVQASFDGADDGPMERWLRQYLAVPVLSPDESDLLAQRLVPLSDLVYVNAPELTTFASNIATAFAPVAYSIHVLANRRSSVGSLALVEASATMTAEQAGAAYVAASDHAVGPVRVDVVDGVPTAVYDMGDDMTLVIWVADGVVALLAVEANENPMGIVTELLKGWRAAGIQTSA